MRDYRANPDQWAYQEHWAAEDGDAACMLELRSRVEALEANAKPKLAPSAAHWSNSITELSPAAQAIFDAWENEWSKASLCHDQRSIAAVLRAAADQLDHPTSAHTLYAFADELEAPAMT